jgi:uncharacterized OsmC-like protein
MLKTDEIRAAFDRNRRAVELRPSIGQGTAVTRVSMDQGLTCHIEDGRWNLTAGMSEKSGGAGAGPDPGVLGRAALGSCLAAGYVMWAAKARIPLNGVQVEIQANYDVRGEYGLGDIDPSYAQIRYVVTVESDAPEADVLRVLDKAESHSPYLAVFRNPQDVRREIHVRSAEG